VLLEFTNDTLDAATLQLMRGDDEFSSGGAMILLHRQESVSLVLNAGSTYRYALKQGRREIEISVRTWQDIQCNATSLFSQSVSNVNSTQAETSLSWTPVEGVTITNLINNL